MTPVKLPKTLKTFFKFIKLLNSKKLPNRAITVLDHFIFELLSVKVNQKDLY